MGWDFSERMIDFWKNIISQELLTMYACTEVSIFSVSHPFVTILGLVNKLFFNSLEKRMSKWKKK